MNDTVKRLREASTIHGDAIKRITELETALHGLASAVRGKYGQIDTETALRIAERALGQA